MIYHAAASRGNADHGWLKSYHSFSFANYFNEEKMHFGALRVLNDDVVAPGRGFGMHPHENMEIITIPLKGNLEHEDSMGNKGVIKEGDVQVMSAGTGVMHSEYNKSKEEEVAFLQIWLFPRAQNLSPRYDQVNIKELKVKNKFYQIISPNKDEQGAWINQDAWFYMGEFDAGMEEKYNLHNKENGVYFFILDGDVEIEGKKLSKRDALGIWNINNLNVKTLSKAQILLIEVPMNL